MIRRRTWALAAGAIATCALATACGDDAETAGTGGGGGSGSTSSTSAATTTVTSGPVAVSSASTTTSSGTGGEGGSGGGPECTGEEAPELTDCDVVTQDCPDPCRPRCIAYEEFLPPVAGTLTACAPLLGEATADEGCTRPNDAPGEDTCAIGFFCGQPGRPADATADRTCRPYCHDAGDCEAQPCILTSQEPTTPEHGYCAPLCDPFADACPEGDACVKIWTTDETFQLFCTSQHGALEAGEACVGGDCAAGLSCEDFGGGPRCHAYCDDDNPCAGAACLAPPGSEGYRVCSTEELVAPIETGVIRKLAVGSDDAIVAVVHFDGQGTFYGDVGAPDTFSVAFVRTDGNGALTWKRVFELDQPSPSPFDYAGVVALDDGGAVLTVGAEGVFDPGGEDLAPFGGEDIVLLRLDQDGEVVWSRRLGGASQEGFTSLAVFGNTLVAVGYFDGATNVGGADLTGATSDLVLAAYDIDGGGHLWSRALPTRGTRAPLARVDADTMLLELQYAGTTLSIDGVTLGPTTDVTQAALFLDVSTGTAIDGFVLAEGDVGHVPGTMRGVAAAAPGTVFSADIFSGEVTLASDQTVTATAQADVFVSSISDGVLDWAYHPTGSGIEKSNALAYSPLGWVAFTGQVNQGSVTIGDLTLEPAPGESHNMWLAVLDAGTGDVARAVDLTPLKTYQCVAFLSDGRVVTGGGGGLAIHDLGL